MLLHEIKEKKIIGKCPYSIQCQKNILHSKVKEILDEKTFQQYENVLHQNEIEIFLKENLQFKKETCPTPGCSEFIIYDASENCAQNYRTFICYMCKEKYCMNCRKKSHGDSTCEENEDNKYINSLISKNFMVRRCPHAYCGLLIQKINGCEKMICKCGCKFCFNCGSEIIYIQNTKTCDCNSKREERKLKRRLYNQNFEKIEQKKQKHIKLR